MWKHSQRHKACQSAAETQCAIPPAPPEALPASMPVRCRSATKVLINHMPKCYRYAKCHSSSPDPDHEGICSSLSAQDAWPRDKDEARSANICGSSSWPRLRLIICSFPLKIQRRLTASAQLLSCDDMTRTCVPQPRICFTNVQEMHKKTGIVCSGMMTEGDCTLLNFGYSCLPACLQHQHMPTCKHQQCIVCLRRKLQG